MTAAVPMRATASGTAGGPSVAALWAVGLLGVGAAVGVVALAVTSEGLTQPYLRAGLVVWVSLPYVLSGVVPGTGGRRAGSARS